MKYNHHKEWLHPQQDRILKIECHLAGTVHLNCVYLWWNVELVEKVFPMRWRVGCWICAYGGITVVLLIYLHSYFYPFPYVNIKCTGAEESRVAHILFVNGIEIPMHHYHYYLLVYLRKRDCFVSYQEILKLMQTPVLKHPEWCIIAGHSFLTVSIKPVVIFTLSCLVFSVFVQAVIHTVLETENCCHIAFPTF